MLFSATFSDEIRRLASEFLTNPAIVEVARRNTAAENVEQVLYPVDRERKEDLLIHLIRRDHMKQVLIFTRTKLAASRLASYLDRRGVAAVAIHSDRSQPERTRALEDFKTGEVTCLVATDVASRGLDIEELPYVVNFELPFEPQDYIHRIGRTGRAGASGIAISLVCMDEVELLKGVQRLLKRQIPYQVVEEFVPDRSVEVRPLRGFGPGGRAGSGLRPGQRLRRRRGDPRARPRPPQADPRPLRGAELSRRQAAAQGRPVTLGVRNGILNDRTSLARRGRAPPLRRPPRRRTRPLGQPGPGWRPWCLHRRAGRAAQVGAGRPSARRPLDRAGARR